VNVKVTTKNSFPVDSLNRGKLPVYVGFGARSTRMQHATFPGSDTTRGAGDGDLLFGRQFSLFHFGTLP
jgi:hypothetical protein